MIAIGKMMVIMITPLRLCPRRCWCVSPCAASTPQVGVSHQTAPTSLSQAFTLLLQLLRAR
jgi:CRISPR/Cas system-associated exonuclease Cas4 (RecB family)